MAAFSPERRQETDSRQSFEDEAAVGLMTVKCEDEEVAVGCPSPSQPEPVKPRRTSPRNKPSRSRKTLKENNPPVLTGAPTNCHDSSGTVSSPKKPKAKPKHPAPRKRNARSELARRLHTDQGENPSASRETSKENSSPGLTGATTTCDNDTSETCPSPSRLIVKVAKLCTPRKRKEEKAAAQPKSHRARDETSSRAGPDIWEDEDAFTTPFVTQTSDDGAGNGGEDGSSSTPLGARSKVRYAVSKKGG